LGNCGKEVCSVIAGILLILSIVVGIQPIFALNVDVTVIIERIKELKGFGFGDAPDFYAVVTIDGKEKDNKGSKSQKYWSGDNDISPKWPFKQSVDYFKGTIPVKIQVYEADSFLRFDDDYADLHPETGKRALFLNVNLDPCSVSGHVTGNCNTTLISSGNSDDSVTIYFKIKVTPPPAQGNLRVYCIQDPIFPSPGEDVTVTVNSLRKSASPGLTIQNPADTIEIWVNNQNAPYATGSGTTLSKSIGSFPQGDFSYGCFVKDGGVPMFSGWC